MHTFTDPAILFFVFGLIAGCVRSNLEIPASIARFLSLYLLMALGLKGGFALAASGLNAEVATSLGCAVLLAVIVPLIGYTLLKRFLGGFDAAALAATYGSVSAVTFITAIQHLETQGLAYGGHMAAAMALMESPAIIIAVFFANALRQQPSTASLRVAGDGTAALSTPPVTPLPLGKVLHESFTDGAQLLLLGAMLIGLITGEAGKAVMAPFSVDLFKGMRGLRKQSPALLAYALLAPLAHAALALGLAALVGLNAGNAALLMVLAGSASYIAVPAVLRYAIPEAQPPLYLGMSLGVTFPFNIMVGIPLYVGIAHWALT